MPGEPTVVYSAANPQQAHLLKGLLEDRGIAAWVVNDALQGAGGELPLGWNAAARVVVAHSDAAEARQFALDFDQQTAHEPLPDDFARTPSSLDWDEWPVCPDCQQRRSARCPVCGVSGMKFALADVQETSAGERVLLFCDSCDDHFLPQWYRLCPQCGHDYGAGIEIGRPGAPEPISLRTWLVFASLLTAGALFFAYFAWLFRR